MSNEFTNFMSNEFTNFIAKAGIAPRHTTRNRPQQNGVAEHANRTIVEAITAALAESGLPHSFWVECLALFIHVGNRLASLSLAARITATTPHELWFGVKPDLAHLRVWGCHVYHHVQHDFCGKLDWHMIPCIFVGYPVDYSGWRLWDPAERKIIITENAQFDERYFPLSKLATGTPAPICSPSVISKTPLSSPTMSDTQVLDLGGVDDSQRRKRRLSQSASPVPVCVQLAPARVSPLIVPQLLPQSPEMTPMSPTPGPDELDVISPKVVPERQRNAPKDWCATVAPSRDSSSSLTCKQETVSPPLTLTGMPARDDLGSPLYSDDITSKSRDRAHNDSDDNAATADDDDHDELDIMECTQLATSLPLSPSMEIGEGSKCVAQWISSMKATGIVVKCNKIAVTRRRGNGHGYKVAMNKIENATGDSASGAKWERMYLASKTRLTDRMVQHQSPF